MNNNPINAIDPLGLRKKQKTEEQIKKSGGTIIDTTKKGKTKVPENDENIKKLKDATKIDEVKDPEFYERIGESLEWTNETGYESGFRIREEKGVDDDITKAYDDSNPKIQKDLNDAKDKAEDSYKNSLQVRRELKSVERMEKVIEKLQNKQNLSNTQKKTIERNQKKINEIHTKHSEGLKKAVDTAQKAMLSRKYAVSDKALSLPPVPDQKSNYHSHPPNGYLGPSGADQSTVKFSSSGHQVLSAPNDSGYSQIIYYDKNSKKGTESNVWVKYNVPEKKE